LVNVAVTQLQLEASVAYAGGSEAAYGLLGECHRSGPGGLILSVAFVTGSPEAFKPVKSPAWMCASGARSWRRYASFHALS